MRARLGGGDMAGGRGDRTRCAGPAVALAVLCLAMGTTAGAQVLGLTGPTPPGDPRAKFSTPPLSPAGMPAARFADLVEPVDPPRAMPGPTTVPQRCGDAGPGAAP